MAVIKGTKGYINVPDYNRVIDYEIFLNNGEIIKRNYPIQGDDMTMEIECFINDVKLGKLQSEIHSLADTKLLLDLIENIRK